MKMRKTEKCRRIVSCTTYENLQNLHNLANCQVTRTNHNGKFAEASTALQYQKRKIPQDRKPLQNNGRNYVSATPQAGALRHIQMAWPSQRANVSDVPREMKHA